MAGSKAKVESPASLLLHRSLVHVSDRPLLVVAAALRRDRDAQLRGLGDHLVILDELRAVLDLHLGDHRVAIPFRLARVLDETVLGAAADFLVRRVQRQRPAVVVRDGQRRVVRHDRHLLHWLEQRARVFGHRLTLFGGGFAGSATAATAAASVSATTAVTATPPAATTIATTATATATSSASAATV